MTAALRSSPSSGEPEVPEFLCGAAIYSLYTGFKGFPEFTWKFSTQIPCPMCKKPFNRVIESYRLLTNSLFPLNQNKEFTRRL